MACRIPGANRRPSRPPCPQSGAPRAALRTRGRGSGGRFWGLRPRRRGVCFPWGREWGSGGKRGCIGPGGPARPLPNAGAPWGAQPNLWAARFWGGAAADGCLWGGAVRPARPAGPPDGGSPRGCRAAPGSRGGSSTGSPRGSARRAAGSRGGALRWRRGGVGAPPGPHCSPSPRGRRALRSSNAAPFPPSPSRWPRAHALL